MKGRLMTGLCLLIPVVLDAEPIYRCETAQGVTFSQFPCAADAEPLHPTPEGFVLPGQELDDRERLDKLRELRQRPGRKETPEREQARRLGYSERAELRRLRIRRDSLERDLRNSPAGSRRQQRAREGLREVSARIDELEKRER